VTHPSSVKNSKIYKPPLHIYRGLTKISVKKVDKESEVFAYLRQKIPLPPPQKKVRRKLRMGFRWSTNYTTFRRPRLNIKLNPTEKEPGRHLETSAQILYGTKKRETAVKFCSSYFHQTLLLV